MLLNAGSIDYTQKYPIILPNKHHLMNLIKEVYHKNLHAKSQAMLAMIRIRFWPISGKQATRHVLRSCIVCFRAKPVS
ncbi:hypothetical protein ALC56_02843 [Trachymyrmex septentrionalis]|uniref:Integrase zinc-binding domain-containing protein n=1 Tax=Trachymyrmex septentrionalis TaxID=34720 RepID=A0A151JZW5_9HYME|nr:hypothetical protein ALC56_02843 [Trachymyrmex septentrionalis]